MPVLASLILAFSMFSRIPVPKVEWTAENRRWILAFFPLVGAAVGGGVWLWGGLAQWLGLGAFLQGAGLALVPLLVTGGIHMDGFCDTVDALASHADGEKKQQILADPHAGAFAVMAAVAYLLGFAALGSEVPGQGGTLAAFAGVFVLSRSLSGLAVVLFPCARDSGLAHSFASAAAKKATGFILVGTGLASAGFVVWQGGAPGAAAVLCAGAVFLVYRRWLIVQFGGLSGDLAGWFVQVCEVCALAVLVLGEKLAAVL